MEFIPLRSELGSNLRKIEALASDENDKPKYEKKTGNCERTLTIDGEGYVTIAGIKIKVGEVGGEGTYTDKYTDVSVDCPAGDTHYECTDYTCADFWKEQ